MRIVLKLSGEALAGSKGTGYDETVVRVIAKQVKQLLDKGHQVGIVTGGGNFWRGAKNNEIDRSKADQMGMLATVMNCIYVSEIFRGEGMDTEIFTSFACGTFTKPFSKDEAVKCLKRQQIVFFAGGTGHPYFSTDTGVVLRAIETDADLILMAKSVDGIYDSDPNVNPNAKRYTTITYDEIIAKNLQAIDATAAVLARDNAMNMRIFDLNEPDGIVNAVSFSETNTGTTVTA